MNRGFFEEVEAVLPDFWEKVTKKCRGKKILKKTVMKGGAPLNLMALQDYLDKLLKLSKGELNLAQANMKSITSVSHARKLKRAKISGRDLLLVMVDH